MKKNLTIVEKKVLKYLERDSRTAFSKIGKKIRKSQQQVSYTVNSLKEKDILQNFYPIIDYPRLDILNFRVFFKVNYVNRTKFEELINYLVKNEHTSWIVTCSGRYDLICTFLAKNPSQFNKILKAIIEKFPKELSNYNVLTTIVNRWFGRKYLFNEIFNSIIFGGDREPIQIDEIDLKILDNLSENARKSSVEIANKLKITPKTVIKHIKDMQNNKIILGFKSQLNLRKINYISRLLLIRYHNVSLELEEQLIEFLKIYPNIIGITKTLGEWDLEIDIVASNSAEYRKVEMLIREKFALLIQNIESLSLFDVYKKNYFPKFLIEK